MEIKHPDSGVVIKGTSINPFERIEETDVYASSNGKWELCPVSHCTLPEGNSVLWVRPD